MNKLVRLSKMLGPFKGFIAIALFLGFISSWLGVVNIVALMPILDIIFETPQSEAVSPESESSITSKMERFVPEDTDELLKEKPGLLGKIGGILSSIFEYGKVKYGEFQAFAKGHKVRALYYIAVFLVIVALLKGLAEFGYGYLVNLITYRFWRDIQRRIYEHVMHMDLFFFQSRSTGKLMARTFNDVRLLRSSLMEAITTSAKAPVNLAVLTATLFIISPTLTKYAFLMLPVAITAIVIFGRKMRHLARRGQQFDAGVFDVMQETYSGIRVVKAFGMEDFENNRFRKATQKSYRVAMKRQGLRKISSPFMEFVGVLTVAAVLLIGGNLILHDVIKSSVFIAYLLLLTRFYSPLKSMAGLNMSVQRTIASSERVFKILDSKSSVVEKKDPTHIEALKSSIRLEGVTFSYSKDSKERKPALKNIDIEFEKNKVYAIVGKSGAGKTTLVNLLCRFYNPDTGRILYDNIDYRDTSLRSLREQIAIVPQETLLFNDTVRNNIAYGRKDISLERVRNAAQLAHAHEFIIEMPREYDSMVGEKGGKLSGGQKQRISIARAIIKNPSILILDEATSSLDTESERLIQEALENLIKGKTVFIIAHRLSTVKKADEIIVFDDGEIIERGTHNELLAREGAYANLCRMQDVFDQPPVRVISIEGNNTPFAEP